MRVRLFEEAPAGTLFARRDLDRGPYEVYLKLRDSFRWVLPDGSGFMSVNAVRMKDGKRRSINLHEPVKRVGILLGIRTLFAALKISIEE